MIAKLRNMKSKKGFNFKKEPKEAAFSVLGILAILIGIYILIPVLLPLLKLVFGVILVAGGYFIVTKNSNLFVFRKL